jgi:hypothetical protein
MNSSLQAGFTHRKICLRANLDGLQGATMLLIEASCDYGCLDSGLLDGLL